MRGLDDVTIGIVGNPNCGKSTIFNGLTGAKQHIGNWPGVTVEKKEGEFRFPSGRRAKVVDTPGIYSLSATSEDERATLSYVLSHDADIFVNVLDATTIERNLYLTLLLCELKVPMVVVVTMMDIARQRNVQIDLPHLSEHLGVPVIGVNATNHLDLLKLVAELERSIEAAKVPTVRVEYPNELEQEIDTLASACVKTSQAYDVSARWVAIKALEGDPFMTSELNRYHDMAPEVTEGAIRRCTNVLKESPDVVLADSRYGVIAGLIRDVVRVTETKIYFSERLDRIVLNRFLGIPIFFLMMYIVFWATQVVGGAFIDFFEIAGDTIFVSGTAHLLGLIRAPSWVIALVSHGVGTALQTVGTFLPPIGFMFLFLSVLEDSGYMARAAFVMDRFMRWIGLPGKSFVPLLVGFGCTVPAIMATRALDSKRDRFLTVFMTPFMSCGAKLPIWTLFAAAFFPAAPGKLVGMMYLTGVVLGVATGLIMKYTLFQGEPTHFIMELPPYHCPRPKHIFLHTWERLKIFIWRAGSMIVPMVLVLGMLNTIGTDGSIGNEDSDKSVLSVVGKSITPVFEPIGVEPDNWPAAVSVFTGLFAKESVIGTMKGLYGQMDAPAVSKDDSAALPEYSFWGGLGEAVASIPTNLSKVGIGFLDPLGLGYVGIDDEVSAEEAKAEESAAKSLVKHFPKGFYQVFSYLLFILLYVPCLAATGTVFREIGKLYGSIFVGYLTILGWASATIFHSLTVTHSALWFSVGLGMLLAMFTAFWAYGRTHRQNMM